MNHESKTELVELKLSFEERMKAAGFNVGAEVQSIKRFHDDGHSGTEVQVAFRRDDGLRHAVVCHDQIVFTRSVEYLADVAARRAVEFFQRHDKYGPSLEPVQ